MYALDLVVVVVVEFNDFLYSFFEQTNLVCSLSSKFIKVDIGDLVSEAVWAGVYLRIQGTTTEGIQEQLQQSDDRSWERKGQTLKLMYTHQ